MKKISLGSNSLLLSFTDPLLSGQAFENDVWVDFSTGYVKTLKSSTWEAAVDVASISGFVTSDEKGAANGVATLDANSKIPSSQIPALAITEPFVVASQAAMLALTAQVGDVAIRTDVNKTFMLSATPATTLSNWTELLFASDVSSVNGQTGNVVLSAADVGATPAAHVGSGGAAHAVATTSVAGFMSAADKLKLDGISPGASGSGTVTSVAASGGTTGLSFAGSPITTAGTLTLGGTLAVSNGGTGAVSAPMARMNLGATTLGANFFTAANPSAVTFPRVNADNTVSFLSDADFRAAIGAGSGSGSGTVTSVAVSGSTGLTVAGSPITTSGTISLTLSANLQSWSGIAPASKANDADVVKLTGDQIIAGIKTFSANATILNGATNSEIIIGLGEAGRNSFRIDEQGRAFTRANAGVVLGPYTLYHSGNHQQSDAHAVATTLAAGFMSAADKLKLDGVASGATANTGTVTSVAVSGSTGLTVGGSPITTAGTISLTLSANLQSWSGIAPATKANDADVVKLTGDQTIAGSKTFSSTVVAPDFTSTSDAKLKTNVRDLVSRGAISPKRYMMNNKSEIGFIADEIEQLYPELVQVDQISGLKTLAYHRLTAVLAAQFNQKIAELEAEIAKLKSEK